MSSISTEKKSDKTPLWFAAIGVLMCAIVIWDQQYCWSSKDDYIFGYLVPFLCAFVLKERFHLLRAIFTGSPLATATDDSGEPTDEFSPPAFIRSGWKTPWILDLIFATGTLFSLLLFAGGGVGTAIYGAAAVTTHENTMGFIGTAFGLVWFASAKDLAGTPLDLRTRLRVLMIFVFPICVWFVSGPFTFLVDSQIKTLLLDKVTATVVYLLNLFDFSLVQEGNIIVLPGGDTVGVADACSGIRSMTACVFAGSFLAAIFLHSWGKKVCFVGVSIVFALVLNVLRTSFLTVWSLWNGSKALDYDFFGNPTDSVKFTLGTVHDVAGWTAMIITFIMLLMLIPLFNLKLTKTDEEMGFEFVDEQPPEEK